MPNPVVHFEITGKDAEALQQYYRDLFGWSLTPMAPDVPYGLVGPEETGGGIGGGVGASMDGSPQPAAHVLRAGRRHPGRPGPGRRARR